MIVDYRVRKWPLKTAYGLAQRYVRAKALGMAGVCLSGFQDGALACTDSGMHNAGSWPLTELSRHRVGVAN